MQADWFFAIGKSHAICEDYAIDGDKCVIVSDGCSSSKHTDLGARLLAHSARILLNGKSDWLYNVFGDAVITQSAILLDTLKMGYECLYATLVVAKVLPSGAINVKMYGDGIIIAISDETIETIEISYTNNMPYYLAYSVDDRSRESYKHLNNELLVKHTTNGNVIQIAFDYDHEIQYSFNPAEHHTILISTDGLRSFEDSQTRLPVPLSTIVQQMVNFKIMKGSFLKRRLNRLIEDLAAKLVFPLDDIGVAGIHLEKGDRPCLTAILEERG